MGHITPMATPNDPSTRREAIQPGAFPRRCPMKPFSSTPRRGKAGMSQISIGRPSALGVRRAEKASGPKAERRTPKAQRRLSVQQVHLVHVNGVAAAEDGDDDAEADSDLRRGDGHHEKGKDLTLVAIEEGAESD